MTNGPAGGTAAPVGMQPAGMPVVGGGLTPEGELKRLGTEKLVFGATIIFLGLIALFVIIAVAEITYAGKTAPDGLIALGSAAVGAMAGLLAPSPGSSS
jgi:uncharacterized integral membrane protein